MKTNLKFLWTFVLAFAFPLMVAQAQIVKISGTVIDGDGLPIPGVNVIIQGTTTGAATDFDGNYSISASQGQVLVFSSIGFQTRHVTVGNNSVINITMEEGTALDEVIITALGIEKTPDAITSAQKIISAETLNRAGNPNPVQALTGKVAGLNISQTSSSVDASYSIQLRGMRTITGNNEALIVINNVKSSADVLSSLPADAIASINVMKGAQGAALYGADGVNGVIVVNTIKGSKSGLQVTYNSTIDFDDVAYLPQRQTVYGQGWDHARDQYENGAWGPELEGGTTAYGLPMYDYDGDGLITLDGLGWGSGTPDSGDNPAAFVGDFIARPNEVKKFFETGLDFKNSVTINTGSEDKFLLFNLEHREREFIIKDDKMERTSVLLNSGATIDKFSINGSFNYVHTNISQSGPNANIYSNLLQSGPDVPITWYKQYPDNAYAWNIYYLNPYWLIKHARQDRTRDFFAATANLSYEINDHISIQYTGNLRQTFERSRSHRDGFSAAIYDPGYPGNLSSNYFQKQKDWSDYYGDFMINFDYDLAEDWNISANIGHNYQENKYEVAENGGQSLQVEGVYNIANVTQLSNLSDLENGHYSKNSNSLFANIDLSYKDYLFINATARNEWSSVLSKSNNSFFYPSAGVSFIPTKAFDFSGSVLDRAKVSANWTRVGNSSAVDWYAINSTTRLGSGYPFQGENSYINYMRPADPNIRPEFVTSTELNLEMDFFDHRVTFDTSVFQQDTKDLITDQTTSSTSGIESQLINIGQMRARGLEINLGLVPVQTFDFKWNIDLGYSHNESRILKVSDDADEVALQTGNSWGIYAQEGALFPLIKVSQMERDPDGNIIVNAENGNPLITSTLQNAGTAIPKNIYNFATSFSYKQFTLSAVADWRMGSKIIAANISNLAFNGTLKETGDFDRNQGGSVLPNSVIMDGNGNYTPNTSVKTGGNDYAEFLDYYSSIYRSIGENLVVGGNAFKIREIALSYSAPHNVLESLKMREIRFGIHARNIFTSLSKDNLNYVDPETSNYGGNAIGFAGAGQYPVTKTYGASLVVKF